MASTVQTAGAVAETLVDAAPLDELLTSEEISSLRLIKMDIEGGELAVLRRFVDRLHVFPPTAALIVEFSRSTDGDALKQVFAQLLGAGFSAFSIENRYDRQWYLNWRRPVPPAPLRELPDEQIDVLLVREASDASTTARSLR
jgi:hypothetical protein